MPTYHYRCKNCGYDFTKYQSFSDDPITTCPECHEEQVRKVYSAVPIEFKGSGFYRTDSRESSSSASLPASEKKTAPAPAKVEAKSA